ncbi:MAP kinase phosphatase with leucine-rich repeats protein 1-like [Palaemon carinicauda]|uniref:MAP kinase phosphatase with leucine-rich repeats protein 1-like n=1 Tax=Palaemon carinicauda TaxID=392227 RepID=UPI0035B5A586
MEGPRGNRIMPAKNSQFRRTSTDSERSLTPSQIQMYVQVGTRWDTCTPLLESGSETESALHRSGASYSCPNLAPRNRKSSIINVRKPSDVETLAAYRTSPHSAGGAFPLRWSTNFSYQGARRSSVGPNLDHQGARRSSVGPNLDHQGARRSSVGPNLDHQGARRSSVGPNLDHQESKNLSATSRATPDCLPPASPPTDLPLEQHMSKRDSRKMQDLGFPSSSKGISYLKVLGQSSSSTPHGSLAPVSPKLIFQLNESPHQENTEDTQEHILSLDMMADQFAKLEETKQIVQQRLENPSRSQHPNPEPGTRTTEGTHVEKQDSVAGKTSDDVRSDAQNEVESIESKDGDVFDNGGLEDVYEKQDVKQKSKNGSKKAAASHSSRVDKEFQDGGKKDRLKSRKKSSSYSKSRHLSDTQIVNVQRSPHFLDGNICQVIDGLFLGNIKAAYSEPLLCRLNIECVVDLSNVMPTQVPSASKSICPCTCALETAHLRTRLCINIPNSEDIDIAQYMDDVNSFIEGSRKHCKNVLVHSYEGKSRAPAVIILYLMTMYGMSFSKALSLVKSGCLEVSLNTGFQRTLQNLDRRLSASSSNSLNLSGTPKSRCAWN